VVGEIKAGVVPESVFELHPGKAAAIMTGAPAPSGADTVVMVEYTTRHGHQVEITKGVSAGDNIVPAGSEAKRGERLLSPGTRLDHAAIAVAASVGRTHILVYSKPNSSSPARKSSPAAPSVSAGFHVARAPPPAKSIRNLTTTITSSASPAILFRRWSPLTYSSVPRWTR